MRFCAYCGVPTCIEHHHPRKGMGGSKKWQGVKVPLCFIHHGELHDKRWRLEAKKHAGRVTVEGYDREGVPLFSRELKDLGGDA